MVMFVFALGGCVHAELGGAYDCFEENGLIVFASTGSVDCVDRTTYALRHMNDDGAMTVIDLEDPAALAD
jgi:hypothetical protein